ncbi:MAG: hypothetical protein IKP46_03395 [Bacteroidales bacterium]|nr:hypothetical protein [Bacteroidales bacterium]
MKKTFILCALLLAFSCTPAPIDEGEGGQEEQQLESIPADDQGVIQLSVSLPERWTKTALGEAAEGKCPVLWAEGDRISIGDAVSEPLAADEAGESSAVFRFAEPLAAPFNVLYPASGTGKVELPASQQFVSGSCDPAALPMYGGGWEPSGIHLAHFSSVLEIPLKGSGIAVSRIMVLSSDGSPLSGTLVPGVDGEGVFDGSFTFEEASSSVTLDCPESGVTLGSSPVSFFVAVPSGEYPGGFHIVVQSTGGGAMRLGYTPAGGRLDAARLVRFPARQFAEDSDFAIISTEEDLLAYAADHSAETCLVIADLDMTGHEWTPFALANVFDGGGHTIKGLPGPMFTTVSGEVRNLVLNSSFSITSGTTSGFLASQVTGTLENITLKGDYSYSTAGELSSTTYVGGLAGRLTGGGSAHGCDVAAKITIASSVVMAADAHFGGLFGQVSSSEINGCRFSGRIEAAPRSPGSYVSKGLNFGGIAGSMSGGQSSGNVQCGETVFTGSWLNTLRFGGVIGYVSGSSTCREDRNDGAVTASPKNTDTDKARYGGVGGVYGIIDNVNITVRDAVNGPEGVVSYLPESSPSYSFCIGGVIQSIYKDAADVSGLVNSGRVVIDGSEISTTSSRRGVFAGGILGSSVCTHVHDCTFEGKMEAVPLSTVRSAFGGIVGQLGDNDPSSASSAALSSCNTTSGAQIIIRRKYTDKPVMAGGIVGISRTCDGSVSNCNAYGTITSTGTLSAASEKQYFGGIAGHVYSSGANTFLIADCKSSVDISLLNAGGSERVCAAGILGGGSTSRLTVQRCTSSSSIKVEGDVSRARLGGVASNLYTHSGGMTASFENCSFTGSILLTENKKLSDTPVAGGIVAYVGAASSSEAVSLRIAGCSSSGSIRRQVKGITSVVASNRSTASVAGGILGTAGLRQVWETEDVSGGEKTCSVSVEVVSDSYVEVELDGCVHSGLLYFNPNVGNEDPLSGSGTHIEVSPNFSVTGGIAGVCAPSGGSLLITGCSNSGSLFPTSGIVGGVAGWIATRTRIIRSDNSGLIYERDSSMPVSTGSGSGYVVGGGIVGGVSSDAENCLVEFCHNSGDVAGSSLAAMPLPCAGGLVGRYGGPDIFVHCKNSGHIRNYPVSGSADLGGYFSGDKAAGKFTSCAAGGYVARGGRWVAADASWASYAFGESNPGSYLQNCTMWDGHSKLPWED